MSNLDQIRLSIFSLVSLFIIGISWRTIFNIYSHGFFRFIAWESIAALILWNCLNWFDDPFSIRQMLSWFFFFSSVIVLIQGIRLLRTANQANNRSESELYNFERTSQLITSGIYHYIRHPLYASLLYLALGSFLKNISLVSLVLVICASLSLIATAKADENECIEYFGLSYKEYMKQTKMFIPFIY
jgi:protein-S-isoprenylcysteine O-methyltransferase Ste14